MKEVEKLTYQCGDLFQLESWRCLHILAQVGDSTVAFISLHEGSNRFHSPVEVKKIDKITIEELNQIAGRDYQYICVMPSITLDQINRK